MTSADAEEANVEQVVFCPACSARYVSESRILSAPDVVLLCTSCGKGSRLSDVERLEQSALDEALDAIDEALRPRVVVGHEVPAAARSIADTLRRGGYAPVCVRSGDQVLAACDPAMPAPAVAVILDVGIPDVLAFEVVEVLRAQPATSSLPVILLASVFERTRYKRSPNRLYGADAYIELHHVPDRLVDVVKSLLKHDDSPAAPVDEGRAAQDAAGSRALARRLISDVALHHGDELAVGLRAGDPFGRVPDALAAGRDLHARAGGAQSDFDDELQAFSRRLLERGGRRG